jgi:CRISPR/Cas system-associated exonuclease Cas4 (RecB family)
MIRYLHMTYNTFLPNDYAVPEKIERHELYNSEVVLEFREFSKPRYRVMDKSEGEIWKEVIGVTTLTNEVLPKHGLLNWAVKKTADFILTNFKHNEYYNEQRLLELVTEAKKQHRQEKESAGDLGTGIHYWIEEYINHKMKGIEFTKTPIELHKEAVSAFLQFENETNIEYLKSEKPVYSRKYGYAGTLDIIARVDGRLSLIDLKTSNFIYPDSYFMQVAGYKMAYEEETGQQIEDHYIVKLPKTKKAKTEIVKIPNIEIAMEAFRLVIPLSQYLYQLKKTKLT